MNWKDIKELQEKKANLKAEAEKIYNRSTTGVKPEDQKEYDAVLSDMEVVQKRIDNAQKLVAIGGETEQTRSVAPTVDNKANSIDAQREEFKRSLLTSSVSGSIVGPTYFADQVAKALSTKVGLIEAGCTVINTPTGTPFYWPTVDDTANSARGLTEGAGRQIGTDPTLANVTLNSYCYSSDIIKVSEEMLRDNFQQFEQLVIDLCTERLARKISYDTVLGNGSNCITGIMNGLAPSLTASAGFTASSGAPWTYGELTSLVYNLDAGHRKDAKILASTSAVAAMAGLQNGTSGIPVWAPGVERKVENLPIVEVQDLATLAVSSKSVVAINPKKYVVRFTGQPKVKVLKELYAAEGKWGIMVEVWVDGKVVDAAAVKTIACHS